MHFSDVHRECVGRGRWWPGYRESGQSGSVLSRTAPDICSYRSGDWLLGADGHDGCQPFTWLHGEPRGFSINLGKTGMGTAKKDDKQVNGAFYHVHWYKYPLTYWLNIITSAGCLEGGDMDIAYLSEIDPTWVDSSLTTILNPEAILFANPIAQGACAADAIASAFNKPLDILFWCAGSQGSMYPFSGWASNESSPLQSSLLLSERMAYKLHRQGQIMETVGADVAVCYEYPSPIIPKERWRYQMVNMYPDSGQCHPLGRSVMRWEAGRNPPNTRKNYGYLMWRKRNCVYL